MCDAPALLALNWGPGRAREWAAGLSWFGHKVRICAQTHPYWSRSTLTAPALIRLVNRIYPDLRRCFLGLPKPGVGGSNPPGGIAGSPLLIRSLVCLDEAG